VTVSSPALLKDLQKQVGALEADLRAQVEALPELGASLRAEHAEATKAGRIAESWSGWLGAQTTQAAVAWVLACVFVRFCEDNDLTDRRWLAGSGGANGDGLARAVDAQGAWIQANPRDNERGWLRESFGWLRSTRAGAALVDEHNPVWRWDVSADAAASLLSFFRRRLSDGKLVHSFDQRADNGDVLDTRFLGDLYQDLSKAERKRFALLQTPEFVEEFILDLTLAPALQEFGPDGLRLIDPTCGSGHFLLGAFHRLLDAWARQAPGMDLRERVQKALDSVHGVDVNPFATAVAKFRVIVAALSAEGLARLEMAPAYHVHIGTGDSLLWEQGKQGSMPFGESGLNEHHYATEDLGEHPDILRAGRYQVVVGNPPFITVKDSALNDAYRKAYPSCAGKYAQSVPFAELFFRLAQRETATSSAGFVGTITSNSFMKRGFGRKLVEEFFPRQDLTHVINSEGAWIPGHNSDGTPTVILVGRRRVPSRSAVRAVLSKGRRETKASGNHGEGPYWQSILTHLGEPGWDDEWLSVTDIPRSTLARHPWSLSGGGAGELMTLIEATVKETVSSKALRIGFFGIMGADDAMVMSPGAVSRHRLEVDMFRALVTGGAVRDFVVGSSDLAFFPYDANHVVRSLHDDAGLQRVLWPLRTELGNRATFSGHTYFSEGRAWYEWHQLPPDHGADARTITWAEVATHNHFAIDAGHSVFKQTAPIIKLPAGASEDDLVGLVALLNSSLACFWLKQRCKEKGGKADVVWARTYQFNSTNVAHFPLASRLPVHRGLGLDALARQLQSATARQVCSTGIPNRTRLTEMRKAHEEIQAKMIALQEELDWEVYRSYGVLDDDLTTTLADLPQLRLGERAFEIALARRVANGDEESAWFEQHGSTPVTELPARWSSTYRDQVERRIKVIDEHPFLHLVERPECKRPWASPTWEDLEAAALSDWVLDRLEARERWFDDNGPRALSVAAFADLCRSDHELLGVLELLVGKPDYELATELTRLVNDEALPFLAEYRHGPSGLAKRLDREDVWALQRRQDAGETVAIPLPTRYEPGDFTRSAYWRCRGTFDVPKERFILYPGAGRDGDKTPVLGWAGWDHLHQAQALARIVLDRQQVDGWDTKRIEPLLAGLAELEPWLEQWHHEYDAAYGGSAADFYRGFLDDQLHSHGLTRDKVKDWRP
jgi:hypothetical protein